MDGRQRHHTPPSGLWTKGLCLSLRIQRRICGGELCTLPPVSSEGLLFGEATSVTRAISMTSSGFRNFVPEMH